MLSVGVTALVKKLIAHLVKWLGRKPRSEQGESHRPFLPQQQQRNMGRYSRNKGKRGERLLVNILKGYGLEAHRSQQYCGRAGTADVQCKELNNFHLEVKWVERLDIHAAVAQSVTDSSATGTVPVVVHKRNKTAFIVTMTLNDFLGLALGKKLYGDGDSGLSGGLLQGEAESGGTEDPERYAEDKFRSEDEGA